MSMERDPIREWRDAIAKHGRGRAWTLAEPHRPQQPFVMPSDVQPVGPVDLRRTRRLTLASDWRLDFGAAIRLLQRHNRLLRNRFGIGWPEVAGLLLAEARRRGVPTESLARVLTTGLRQDARGQGA